MSQDRRAFPQGRRWQDHNHPDARPYVCLLPRRSRDRTGWQPRCRVARLSRAARDDEHDHQPARTPRTDRAYADIRAYTSQAPTRLEVVAADDDPRITDALREQDFQAAVRLLEVHYNLICMDTGTGVLESAAKGILQLADQIVLITAPSLDCARTASSTLDWLEQNGYEHLVSGAVALINAVRPRTQIELHRLEEHFAERCRSVIRVPWDQHLETGAESALEHLKPATRSAYLQLAASVADGFGTPIKERSTQ